MWAVFSIAATLLQVELIAAGWIDAMGVAAQPWVTSALLVAVGVYQWLPTKRACLDHCRSPVQFLVEAYRPGAMGALLMGLQHGLYCLGCCWALMLLLFVGGVMNLLWVAAITAIVFRREAARPRRLVATRHRRRSARSSGRSGDPLALRLSLRHTGAGSPAEPRVRGVEPAPRRTTIG